MAKVIKKSVERHEPVIIGRGSAQLITSKNNETDSEENRQSLAFTEIIKYEIDGWTEKATKKVQSKEQLHAQEIEQAFHKGYEKGLADGIEREQADRIKAVDMLLKEAKKKSEDAIRGLEVKVIELSAAIVEKIIRRSLANDPTLVEHIVAETMSHIIGSETVVLKVSPEDFKAINAKYDRWLGMAGSVREFRIEIDKRLRSGDCLVETEGGIIDGVISDRIDVLVEELLKVSR